MRSFEVLLDQKNRFSEKNTYNHYDITQFGHIDLTLLAILYTSNRFNAYKRKCARYMRKFDIFFSLFIVVEQVRILPEYMSALLTNNSGSR